MIRPRFLLDTNICIYIHRQRPHAVLRRFEQLASGEAAISVVTLGELIYGAERSIRRDEVLDRLDEFTSLVPVLDMPEKAGVFYGAIRAGLESKGTPIGNNDLWIAAHAQASKLILVTNNEREFGRVPSLTVENWA